MVHWSVIVVGDKVMPSSVLVPKWCWERGRGRRKDGARVVINTDRGKSVLVWAITTGTDWHDHTTSMAGSGQKDSEGLWTEWMTVTAGLKRRKALCSKSKNVVFWVWAWANKYSNSVCLCVCNLRSGDRIWALLHPVCALPRSSPCVCLEKKECADWKTPH